ncbi:MAG TPA: hypothetical protein VE378_03020 [Nitrososphaeraceae archaeon]|nr:hypothetical protein [Nitrososphaeraceae archaeon]
MNTRGKLSLFMSGLAILTLIAGLLVFGTPILGAAAQGSNMTNGSQLLTNDSQQTQATSQIPDVALQSILEQTRSANATSFAIGNIINQTGGNATQPGLSNATQPGSDNTTIKSVIEEARNTNATSFAAGNIINQTKAGSNTTTS